MVCPILSYAGKGLSHLFFATVNCPRKIALNNTFTCYGSVRYHVAQSRTVRAIVYHLNGFLHEYVQVRF